MEDAKDIILRRSSGTNKVNYIENSMASGVDTTWKYLTENSKNLSRNEIKAIATLYDDPFLKDDIERYVLLSVHTKGWITDKLYKFWIPFARAFQTVLYNKRVQRILKKFHFGGRGDWD